MEIYKVSGIEDIIRELKMIREDNIKFAKMYITELESIKYKIRTIELLLNAVGHTDNQKPAESVKT